MGLETESFDSTFGKKSNRKKVNLKVNSLEEMVKKADDANDSYVETKDNDRMTELADTKDAHREYIFAAGKSKRIGTSCTKLLTVQMSFYRFWMPEILWELVVITLKNFSRKKRLTNIWYLC